ncbi:MAG: hypothetical protein JJE30_01740 [Desulfuromonadales bacterium]|nr:hypothetical protein [Desulfuromonadales bacterium]
MNGDNIRIYLQDRQLYSLRVFAALAIALALGFNNGNANAEHVNNQLNINTSKGGVIGYQNGNQAYDNKGVFMGYVQGNQIVPAQGSKSEIWKDYNNQDLRITTPAGIVMAGK